MANENSTCKFYKVNCNESKSKAIYHDPEELDDSKSKVNNENKELISNDPQTTVDSWENHKENIQPLKKGRNIDDLMQSLQLIHDNKTTQQLLAKRKEQFELDLKATSDKLDEQFNIWHDYIDWLEQNVPNGGKVNNITNAIEECIEIYYDKKEFKQDKRLFNIFMKFKNFCDEPIEIFGFMYANSICTLLARFYLNWSWQYEIRKNMKRAEDLIKLGLKNLATPRDVLLEAESQIKFRIDRMIRSGELDNCPDLTNISCKESQRELAQGGIRAALQTLKFKVNKGKNSSGCIVSINRVGIAVDKVNVGGLKSQTKLVNGVPVAKNKKPSTKTSMDKKSNKLIQIYNDDQENKTDNKSKENSRGDENSGTLGERVMMKVPTSQTIQSVGRIGFENRIKSSGIMQNSDNNNFKVPLSRS